MNKYRQRMVSKSIFNSRLLNGLMIVLCVLFLLFVRLHVNPPIGGDEPSYLLMDYSLVHDHDLNLKNNYINRDWTNFMPNVNLVPQGNPAIVNLKSPKVYSPHGIGLSLLLLPGYYLAAKDGALIEMLLLAAVVIYLTWVWTKQVTNDKKLAYFAALFLLICYFFNGLSGSFYPDMAIAAGSLIVLIMLEKFSSKRIFQLLFGLVLGPLILLHFRALDIVLPALVVLGYRLWKSERKLPWLSALVVLAFIVYFFITLHQWFGVWNINTAYGPGGATFGLHWFTHISAMLFDSYRGLLIYNPLILLVFVGIPLWFKQNTKSFFSALLVLGPSIVILALFNQWNGGDSPLGRYIIDFLPALMPSIGFVMGSLHKLWQKVVVAALVAITYLITLDNIIVKFPPVDGSRFFSRSTLFTQIEAHTHLAIDHLLPSYSNATTLNNSTTSLISRHGGIKLLLCYSVVLAAFLYGCHLAKSTSFHKVTKVRYG